MNPSRPRLQLVRALLMSLLAAAALVACESPEPLDFSVRPVVVEPVIALDQAGVALYPGTIVAREDTALSFRIGGALTRRHVDAGDRVRRGAVLAELDPEDARLTVRAAEAAVAAAEADAALAEAELKRHRDLLARGFISASAYELRENQYALAKARAEQARAEANVQRNQSRYTRLTAAQDGLVTATLADEGEVVASGQPVLRFVPDEGREVEIQVPEGRLDRFTPDLEVMIALWAHPDARYRGQVREVSPQADMATRTHRVRVRLLDADERVQLGMTANLLLGQTSTEPLFGVRHSALGQHEDQPVLWRVIDGAVQPVAVTVVRFNDHQVVLRGALEAGETVVSAGVHRLHSGQRVTITARPYAAEPVAARLPQP